ncbi:uncharacterized protein LOC141497075 [Macrotis lagotis]|uniref:uncharacterized protein LOC141497075 n=1 Tax=Macrotis lagotis TaxID=92651 RepID=UPI003D69079E
MEQETVWSVSGMGSSYPPPSDLCPSPRTLVARSQAKATAVHQLARDIRSAEPRKAPREAPGDAGKPPGCEVGHCQGPRGAPAAEARAGTEHESGGAGGPPPRGPLPHSVRSRPEAQSPARARTWPRPPHYGPHEALRAALRHFRSAPRPPEGGDGACADASGGVGGLLLVPPPRKKAPGEMAQENFGHLAGPGWETRQESQQPNLYMETSAQDRLAREGSSAPGMAEARGCGSALESQQRKEENPPGTDTGEKAHRCHKCGNSATLKGECICQNKGVAPRQKIHSEEGPYKCSECERDFCLSTQLMHHLRSHAWHRPYACTNCENSFGQVSDLVQHLKTHAEEKNYKCKVCGKVFYSSSGLSRHKKFHAEVKLFRCNECDRTFHKNKQLARHQRVHSGVKLYKCNKCGKAFFENKSLTVHQRIHSDDKPHKCQECGKAFRRSSHLTRHQKTHAE